MTPPTITISAPAKINLTLDVGRRRPDGYHDIRTVMQTIHLSDQIEITPMPDRPGLRLEVTGDEASGVPTDAANIVYRAAARMQEFAPGNLCGLHIRLRKTIPAQAGLGGGSSDAAATLPALDRLWGLALSPDELTAIATSLGADVSFFLMGGTALVGGLGDRVMAMPPLSPPWYLVIVKPPVGVSTAWAYAALDALPDRVLGRATETWGDGQHKLGNDFEQVVLAAFPEVADAYELLRTAPERQPGFPPLLCGSGSALFCRTTDEAAAQRLACRVRDTQLGKAWVSMTGEME